MGKNEYFKEKYIFCLDHSKTLCIWLKVNEVFTKYSAIIWIKICKHGFSYKQCLGLDYEKRGPVVYLCLLKRTNQWECSIVAYKEVLLRTTDPVVGNHNFSSDSNPWQQISYF